MRRRAWRVILKSALVLALAFQTTISMPAQGKRLQIMADKANVHLDPDEGSPILETLGRGSTLTLASAIKARSNWFYVYFVSLETGKTRAGYVLDSFVRKLFPDLKVLSISSEDEISDPKDINLDEYYVPILAWGMSKDNLIEKEGRPHHQEKVGDVESVQFRRVIMAKNCLVEYLFADGKLVTSRYHLLENYADKNRYIDDYQKIKDFLTLKIGAPRSDRVIWQDESFKSRNDRWGAALSIGHLEFRSSWLVKQDTELLITLAGGDSRVAFGAECNDVKYKTSASF